VYYKILQLGSIVLRKECAMSGTRIGSRILFWEIVLKEKENLSKRNVVRVMWQSTWRNLIDLRQSSYAELHDGERKIF